MSIRCPLGDEHPAMEIAEWRRQESAGLGLRAWEDIEGMLARKLVRGYFGAINPCVGLDAVA